MAVAALTLAWACDRWLGEPPNRWHPVAWLGSLLGPVGRRLSAAAAAPAFIGGALAWCLLALGLGAAAAWLQSRLGAWPLAAQVLLLGLLLKPALAWSLLHDEVAAVEQAQNLAAARERLARLVSRDVQTLDADQVRESALETLAENLNDSLVAPLFWFCIAGLPGAWVYRMANTADAMWGYRGRYEWAGKWAARADDGLSWVPARLTALLLAPLEVLRTPLWREAGKTPSPNGGWPMAALALRLGVRLRKPGVYALNERAPSPDADRFARGLAVARHAACAAWLAAAAVLALRGMP